MKYVVTTDKDVDTVCSEMEVVVPAHQFGIVAVHDLQETMQKKGVEFDKAVKVFEICNPKKAKAVLEKTWIWQLPYPVVLRCMKIMDKPKSV